MLGLLTIINCVTTAVLVHLIVGCSMGLLVLLNFMLICYYEIATTQESTDIRILKSCVVIGLMLLLLHILTMAVLFYFAYRGDYFP